MPMQISMISADPKIPSDTGALSRRSMTFGRIEQFAKERTRSHANLAAVILAEEKSVSKKAADHHTKASEHHAEAAKHHSEAAKHHGAGHHEKAAHHAHTASGHASHARTHAEEAGKAHAEEHGKK
jgi:hypothetical protein